MSSKRLFRRSKPTEDVDNIPKSTSKVEDGSKNQRTLGLRKCIEPQDSSPQAIDIVFVHGLTGDREKTWTHPTTSCFWPEKLLPLDLPGARIFTYGYDADVAHFFSPVSQSRIGDHAQTLMGSLAHVRERTETADRPLFFVAHSLGGLVVEDMLVSSKNSAEDDFRQVLESTEGIAFMGTPHCGSHFADWAKVFTSVAKLVNRLNQSIITVLQPESEVLARIQQDFHTMIRARNDAGKHKLQVSCFFEDHDMPGVGPIVPKHSAILAGYSSFSIPANHTGMTKFLDPDDVGYERVSGELWRWVRQLNKRREKASVDESSVTPGLSSDRPRLLLEDTAARPQMVNNFQGQSMNNTGHLYQGSTVGPFQYGSS